MKDKAEYSESGTFDQFGFSESGYVETHTGFISLPVVLIGLFIIIVLAIAYFGGVLS
jgi:hypothetical protein